MTIPPPDARSGHETITCTLRLPGRHRSAGPAREHATGLLDTGQPAGRERHQPVMVTPAAGQGGGTRQEHPWR